MQCMIKKIFRVRISVRVNLFWCLFLNVFSYGPNGYEKCGDGDDYDFVFTLSAHTTVMGYFDFRCVKISHSLLLN